MPFFAWKTFILMPLSLFHGLEKFCKNWPRILADPCLPDGESGTAVAVSVLKTERNYGTTVQPRSQRAHVRREYW